jgi:hypothetical protein
VVHVVCGDRRHEMRHQQKNEQGKLENYSPVDLYYRICKTFFVGFSLLFEWTVCKAIDWQTRTVQENRLLSLQEVVSKNTFSDWTEAGSLYSWSCTCHANDVHGWREWIIEGDLSELRVYVRWIMDLVEQRYSTHNEGNAEREEPFHQEKRVNMKRVQLHSMSTVHSIPQWYSPSLSRDSQATQMN